MIGYFAYTRVSTVKQGERGTSLDEQRSAIEAYAARSGLTITNWFQEMETAAKAGRREFTRMLSELRNHRARGVIIHKIDRSARNLKDWAQLGDLIDIGIDVRFAHESLDLTSRGGRLAADIQAVVAADFIRNHRQVVRMGFEGRLKQGLYPLPAPRGYLDRGQGNPKVIDPVTGPLVRLAFDLYASESYTFDTLRDVLFHRGLRTRGGKAISLKGMSSMLGNTFYFGLIHIHRTGQSFQGVHQPLLTKRTFDRVQAVIHGRAFARPQKHEFPYRRLIRCSECGYVLTGELQKSRAYYRCHSRTCHGTSLREDAIEHEIRSQLSRFAFSDQEFGDIRDLARIAQAREDQRRQDRSLVLRRDLDGAEHRLARLTDAFLEGVFDRGAFETKRASLIEERLELQSKLDDLAEDDFAQRALDHFELARTAYLGFASANSAERREIVQKLTSNLAANGKKLVVTLRNDFERFLESVNTT